ncbi:MAG: bifunctional phosphopantothenoylcysteine decarboxylase/phosphopantothenate--cysteine ligase CoaBC [Bacteroidales bacterium]|nr:bifunctional phosphopantothenoylcysteine decarboxylase/phosphopantothenate--cysteine ligase CoaBC [Bacteroidales bacterium]
MGKHIVIGISGGIAAYKTLSLIRLFKKNGYEVRVTATRNALQFVTPLTIETLSQNRLYTDMFDTQRTLEVEHISMAEWADALVVAPATANIIAKFSHGIADDALSTLFLAVKKPVFIAPAMNSNMFGNIAVQQNIANLQERGCHILSPNDGFLACGTTGSGRMQEPEEIFDTVDEYLSEDRSLQGKNVMITAGPTYEPIDPVRFIGNHSSGLMGFCLAEAAARKGAKVALVTGPSSCTAHHSNITRYDVKTAEEMYQQCMKLVDNQDIIIMSAAVADYTPAHVAPEKIKKDFAQLSVELVKTKDILASVGKIKRDNQLLIGFALETENEIENAKKKLHNKNADLIVLNSLRTEGAGFRTSTNQVTIFSKDGREFVSELKSKQEIATEILQTAQLYIHQ